MKNVFILDSSALLAFLSNEKGANIVSNYIKNAADNKIELLLHSINCLEIFYKTYKKGGKKKSLEVLSIIQKLPILIIEEFNIETLKIAGEIKGKYKLSLTDSAAISLSKIKKGILLTTDHHEMEIIKKNKIIDIKWVR